MAFQQFPQKGGIPSGNTAGRPSGSVIGDTYYNGEGGLLEIFNGSAWVPCSSTPAPVVLNTVTDVGTSRAFNNGALTVAFTVSSLGGAATSYAIYYANALISSATSSPATITGLTGGSTGNVYVVASNSFGAAAASNTVAGAPTTVPGQPTSVTATTSGSDASVAWTAPSSNGGKTVTGYTVVPYIGATAQTTTTTTGTSVTVTGLSGGSVYTFKVYATNANGNGAESVASGNFTAPLILEYLVVGGGGGGGGNWGGAAGAGGTLTGNLGFSVSTSYSVTVGGGGGGSANAGGSTGGVTNFSNITSNGGAPGPGEGGSGSNGACGSGGSRGSGGGSGNIGYSGGGSGGNTSGGGGGNGSAGASGGGNAGGAGGIGITSNITGSAIQLGGGGGGMAGYNVSGPGGTASYGGGEGAHNSTHVNAYNGTVNTGGGGGGGGNGGGAGGAGGSGVVRLKYPNGRTITIGSGLTGATTASGNFTVASITAGTGNVSWS